MGLQASLEVLVRSLQSAVVVEDEHRRITLANQRFCDMFGIPVPPEQLVGADCSNAAEQSKGLFVDPDQFVARVGEILRRRDPVFDERLELVDGRVLERDFLPINTETGYGGHFWQYRDISDRNRSERRLRTLFGVSRAIAHADDERRALAQILAEVGTGLGFEFGSFLELDREAETLHLALEWHQEGIDPLAAAEYERVTGAIAYRKGEGLPGCAWASDVPVWLTRSLSPADVAVSGTPAGAWRLVVPDRSRPFTEAVLRRREFAEKHGVRNLIACAVRQDDDVVGVLEFLTRKPRTRDDFLVALLDSVAVQVAQFLERRRAQDALTDALAEVRRHRDDLVVLLNQLRVVVVLLDGAGRVVFLSESCRSIEGVDCGGARGRQWEAVLPFDERSASTLRQMMALAERDRSRMSLNLQSPAGRAYALEADLLDYPPDPEWRALYLYDVTEVQNLRGRLDVVRTVPIVGSSRPMERLLDLIVKVGRGDWTVLIEGETGVGKELVARAIHAASGRRRGPFVAVNCAGLTESLLSSQLFGHRKGAFTGAITDQEGLFDAADGGTIFLDEIGDLPLTMQTSLLRVLQEKEVTRLGDTRPHKVNVRIVAATNVDLQKAVQEGRFREDLLYRLRVARVHVPPLRDRAEDIPQLATAFLDETRAGSDRGPTHWSVEALRALQQYRWPGNVRELRSAVHHAVIHGSGDVIRPSDLPPEVLAAVTGVERAEGDGARSRIELALRQAGGSRTRAARLLGISRATLYRRLTELGIPSRD